MILVSINNKLFPLVNSMDYYINTAQEAKGRTAYTDYYRFKNYKTFSILYSHM